MYCLPVDTSGGSRLGHMQGDGSHIYVWGGALGERLEYKNEGVIIVPLWE